MTKEEAITEERGRYLKAILKGALHLAHIHLMVLHRLAGNGYTRWSHELDKTLWKEVV